MRAPVPAPRAPVQHTACGPPLWRARPLAVGHPCDAACAGCCLGHLCSRLPGAAFATGACAAGGW
eukprot:6224066-Alexandrium_andersonii.AAC.1